MFLSPLARFFKPGTMTRDELFNNAKGLDVALNCVNHLEALLYEGWYKYSCTYPPEFKRAKRQLQIMLDSASPSVHVLNGTKQDYSVSIAGKEFAKYVRVRDRGNTVALWIYVQNQMIPSIEILRRLLASFIWNTIGLVPEEFETSGGLRRRDFRAYMRKGPDCFDKGLALLRALPRLELGNRKFLCIVDGLEYAEEDPTTTVELTKLFWAFRDLVIGNNGQLIYTLSKESKIIC